MGVPRRRAGRDRRALPQLQQERADPGRRSIPRCSCRWASARSKASSSASWARSPTTGKSAPASPRWTPRSMQGSADADRLSRSTGRPSSRSRAGPTTRRRSACRSAAARATSTPSPAPSTTPPIPATTNMPTAPEYWVIDAMAATRSTTRSACSSTPITSRTRNTSATLNNSGARYSPGTPRSALLTVNFTF